MEQDKIEHALSLMSSIRAIKADMLLCDFKIQVEKEVFSVHRLVLAATCGYFKSLFSGNLLEAEEMFVRMQNFKSTHFELCIEFMYSGSCSIPDNDVFEVFEIADYLAFTCLKVKCQKLLTDQLSPENCLLVLNFARKFHCDNVIQAAEKVVKDNFETVISSEYFNQIDKGDLLQYIENASYDIKWKAITIWSVGKEDNFPYLVKSVNLSEFPSSFLVNSVIREPLVLQFEEVRLLTAKAIFRDADQLMNNLTCSNCFVLREWATDDRSRSIIQSFMVKNFSSIVLSQQLPSLPKDDFLVLLKSSQVKSEKLKWEAMMKWVKSEEHRVTSFPDLFRCIKLEKLSLSFLNEVIRTERLVKESTVCLGILVDATLELAKRSAGEKGKSGKRQPSSGRIYEGGLQQFQYIKVIFPEGIYQGVQCPAFQCKYFIPWNDIRNRLVRAFNEGDLFVVERLSGTDFGRITVSDIPLNKDRNLGPLTDFLYKSVLDNALRSKGY